MTCLDVNVVMDILLGREREEVCRRYLAVRLDEELAISSLTVSTVMYYVEKYSINAAEIQRMLERYTWLPCDSSEVKWAFENYEGEDFEDALQVACALRSKCSRLATGDRSLAKKYAGVMPIDLIA